MAFALTCAAIACPAAAELWDDLDAPAAEPAFIAAQFDQICVASRTSLSDAWALAAERGWHEAPAGEVDAYLTGALPATRRGLVPSGQPGVFLSLTARGHSRKYREGELAEGERPETYPVTPGKVSGDGIFVTFQDGKPVFSDSSPHIGSTVCMMTGRVSDPQQLVDLVQPVFHPPGSAGTFTGLVAPWDRHRGRPDIISYAAAGARKGNLRMLVSYPAEDGSAGFRLIYSKQLPVGTPAHEYSIPE